jgi:hypothetical protein
MEYLHEVEKGATEVHLARVAEVYGEDCGEPYDTVFMDRMAPDAAGTGDQPGTPGPGGKMTLNGFD